MSVGKKDKDSNVSVVCRFRPQNSMELSEDGKNVVEVNDEKTQVILKTDKQGPYTFNFDHIFDVDAKQEDVYRVTGSPIVKDMFQGYNGTLFVYGQTGAGKSFTMMGAGMYSPTQRADSELKGLIPRIVEDIFDTVSTQDEHMEFTIQVSYIEIYLEKLRDLFNPSKKDLVIKEDKDRRGIFVHGAMEVYVSSVEDVFELMKKGTANRVTGSTRMNVESSRSHSIFIITLTQKDIVKMESKSGKLFLVDLAGSEKVKKTRAEGKLLEEAKNINKSLSALGNVINALTDGKSTHVPYRDSKLTRLLQDSLGGNSRTSLIINCSCSSYNEFETLSTLRFGVRAKNIKNKPIVNKELSVKQLTTLLNKAKADISDYKAYISVLEVELKKFKGTDFDPSSLLGGPKHALDSDDSEASEVITDNETLREQITYLENKLSVEEEERAKQFDEIENLKDLIQELELKVNKKAEYCDRLDQEIAELKDRDAQTEEAIIERDKLKLESEKLSFTVEELSMTVTQLKTTNESLVEQLSRHKVNPLPDIASPSTRARTVLNVQDTENSRPFDRAREKELLSLIAELQGNINRLRESKTNTDLGLITSGEDIIYRQNIDEGPLSHAENEKEQTETRTMGLAKEVHDVDPFECTLTDKPEQRDENTRSSDTPGEAVSYHPLISSTSVQQQTRLHGEYGKPHEEMQNEIRALYKLFEQAKAEHFAEVEEYEIEIQSIKGNSYENQAGKLIQFLQEHLYDNTERQLKRVEKVILARLDDIRALSVQLDQVKQNKEQRYRELEKERNTLLKDLQNRIDKVIDLELRYDDLCDRYESLASAADQNSAIQKMLMYENTFKTQQQQIRDLRIDLSIVHNQLKMRGNRIKILETSLERNLSSAQKEKAAHFHEKDRLMYHLSQRDKYIRELEEDLKLMQAEMGRSRRYSDARIIIPLRGGAHKNSSKLQHGNYANTVPHEQSFEMLDITPRSSQSVASSPGWSPLPRYSSTSPMNGGGRMSMRSPEHTRHQSMFSRIADFFKGVSNKSENGDLSGSPHSPTSTQKSDCSTLSSPLYTHARSISQVDSHISNDDMIHEIVTNTDGVHADSVIRFGSPFQTTPSK